MPSEKHDLLRLQMSAIGVIDFDQNSISLDAVLYDSRLAGKFPVTGSMALRVNWGGDAGLRAVDRRLPSGVQAAAAFPGARAAGDHASATAATSGCAPRSTSRSPRTRCSSVRRVELFARPAGFAITGTDRLRRPDPVRPVRVRRRLPRVGAAQRTTRRTCSRCPSKASCPARGRCTSGARRRSRSSGATSRCGSTRR